VVATAFPLGLVHLDFQRHPRVVHAFGSAPWVEIPYYGPCSVEVGANSTILSLPSLITLSQVYIFVSHTLALTAAFFAFGLAATFLEEFLPELSGFRHFWVSASTSPDNARGQRLTNP
jgi:hypothetical protein